MINTIIKYDVRMYVLVTISRFDLISKYHTRITIQLKYRICLHECRTLYKDIPLWYMTQVYNYRTSTSIYWKLGTLDFSIKEGKVKKIHFVVAKPKYIQA